MQCARSECAGLFDAAYYPVLTLPQSVITVVCADTLGLFWSMLMT